MTDKKIIEVAGSLMENVYKDRVYEEELEGDYNFILFRKGQLAIESCFFYRSIEIIYTFEGEQKLTDNEIISKFEEIGLKPVTMEPQEFQKAKTNEWVNQNVYIFKRPERRK